MDYTEITELALSYTDREDDEVTSRIDSFIQLVESRINRKLKVLDMSARSVVDLTTTDPEQKYFQLPDDFGGLRDIEVNTENNPDGASYRTLGYVNPEQMNNLQNSAQFGNATRRKIFYTIIARQIQIFPPQDDGFLEITYYQRVPNLNASDPNNWISDEYPDAYIYGLCSEISSFVKDAQAFALWKARYDEALEEIRVEDKDSLRWSGTPLTMKVG